MRGHDFAQTSDKTLLHDLSELIVRERATTAEVVAHIAEVDSRRLYLPEGRSTMHAYCVEVLRLSDDAAYKRIQVARAARQFPALFDALADGRLHLAGACLLAPHLTAENAEELLSAATHRRKSEIEVQLARMFPVARPSGPAATVRVLPAIRPPLAPGQVSTPVPGAPPGGALPQLSLDHTGSADSADPPSSPLAGSSGLAGSIGSDATPSSALAPGQVEPPQAQPSAVERYLVRLTIGKDLHDKLRYAQALLSHAVPSGDVAEVLDRALDTLIAQLEKRKLGARTRSRTVQRILRQTRYIPPAVRKAVWERDQSRCTFVGENGHRCEARRFLEFDHTVPFARDGKSTVEGLRLRCHSHNQHAADKVFGSEFMKRKREASRKARAKLQASADVGKEELVGGSDPSTNSNEVADSQSSDKTREGTATSRPRHGAGPRDGAVPGDGAVPRDGAVPHGGDMDMTSDGHGEASQREHDHDLGSSEAD